MDNVKPTGLVIGAALLMLAVGKPLTGSRAFGGAMFSLPQMGDCKAMVRRSHTQELAVLQDDQIKPPLAPRCRPFGLQDSPMTGRAVTGVIDCTTRQVKGIRM